MGSIVGWSLINSSTQEHFTCVSVHVTWGRLGGSGNLSLEL